MLLLCGRTEWNATVVDELFAGCKNILEKNKVAIRIFSYPGIRIPLPSKDTGKLPAKKPDALLHSDIIQGDTPHLNTFVARTDGIPL